MRKLLKTEKEQELELWEKEEKNKKNILEIWNQTIAKKLKQITAKKAKHRGRIARLKELLRELFHFSDSEKTSFKERRTISPKTTANPY